MADDAVAAEGDPMSDDDKPIRAAIVAELAPHLDANDRAVVDELLDVVNVEVLTSDRDAAIANRIADVHAREVEQRERDEARRGAVRDTTRLDRSAVAAFVFATFVMLAGAK